MRLISHTGWSSELGYEIYLRDSSFGDQLWEKIMDDDKSYNIQSGHTSAIRRIEGAMLSYHADIDMSNNPFELGLDRLINLDIDADFIGKAALHHIAEEGVTQKQIGLEIKGLH